MKCKHCSARIDRAAWFCPNCKRSAPRGAERHLAQMWLPLTIGVSVVVAGGVLVGRGFQPPAASDAEVKVREVAIVEITPREEPDEAPAPPKRSAEKKKREEKPKLERRVAVAEEPVEAPEPAPAPPRPQGRGAISVSIDQPVRTFVYLNGGTLLGEAPLRNASIPAGKHTLVFWSPSVGGRATRTVNVAPGEKVEVVQQVRARERFTTEAPAEEQPETPG